MQRLQVAVALAVTAGFLPIACSRAEPSGNDAGQTQAGAAATATSGERSGAADADCGSLPSSDDLKKALRQAPGEGGPIGGMFDGKMEWAAVVNRSGQLCAAAVATDDPASGWLGSAAIAKAKAFTANAFSTDTKALSTARLYTLAQPGHSLYGAGAANPFNPDCLGTPHGATDVGHTVCGGTIVFGGGVALYRGKTRVGGLGASGDTACADHEMAKRMRHLAGYDPPDGEFVDDIVYVKVDGPSQFAHPVCDNTYRNGKKIGDETKAMGY
jgi:uncharacterized protein GlcG (DUF336 family)